VSKDRKLRRAAREAEQARAVARNARVESRRRHRRALWRTITLYDLRKRRTGRLLARRSTGQRALIVTLALGALVVIWQFVPNLALRVALSLILLLSLPVFVIVAFDRRSS
jgi:hypothetical protein